MTDAGHEYLHPGYKKPYPVEIVLRDLAAQEGCDGEPYDAMVFAAATITTLRAQLAEARAAHDADQKAYLSAFTRADRAEAALAAQTEADAWQPIETAPKDGTPFLAFGGGLDHTDICRYNEVVGCWNCSEETLDDTDHEPDGYNRPAQWRPLPAPNTQPHDRTALDRYREKVLRKAAAEAERTGTCLLPSGHFLSERCRDAILALIDKEKTE